MSRSKEMPVQNRTYAMDTHFLCGDNKGVPVGEQARMVKEAGYDDFYATISLDADGLEKVKATQEACRSAGLGLSAVYVSVDLLDAWNRNTIHAVGSLIDLLQPPTRLEFALNHGGFGKSVADATLDDKALAWLGTILPLVEAARLKACLYPHFNYYLETLSDALRLCRKISSPDLGLMFCGYHWYRVDKEPELADLLAEAAHLLYGVNLCGSRHLEGDTKPGGMNPTIEPLDTGDLDNALILQVLRRIGYTGPIGIQGYGITIPAPEALVGSFRKLSELTSLAD